MKTFAYFSSASQAQNALNCGFSVRVHLYTRVSWVSMARLHRHTKFERCRHVHASHPADLASSVNAPVPPKPDHVSTIGRALYGDVFTTDSS